MRDGGWREFVGACAAALLATIGTVFALAASVAFLVLIVYAFQK